MKKKFWLVKVIFTGVFFVSSVAFAIEEKNSESYEFEVSSTTESTEIFDKEIKEIKKTEIESVGKIEDLNLISDEVKKINNQEEQSLESKDYGKYVSLVREDVVLYKNIDLIEVVTTEYKKGSTFYAKEKVAIKDETYFSLYNSKNVFVGYVIQRDVKESPHPGGVYQSYGKYITVTKKEGNLLSDFNGTKKGEVIKLFENTYLAKGMYFHFEGSIYYSIYNNKGVWQGYIKDENISLADEDKQGTYQPFNAYVTLNKKNYSTWENFNGQKKYESSDYLNRTFIVKGKYHDFSGRVYYDLYDLNDNFYGFVNKNATSFTNTLQGKYHSYGKYVSVKNINDNTWEDFNWQVKYSLIQIKNRTFLAKGKYYHVNGNIYYSIYDKNNRWYGYIEHKNVDLVDKAQGKYRGLEKYITVTNGKGTIWKDFDWKKKSSTNKMNMKTYYGKGEYKHFNGQTYYSIYDSKGKWHGYLNARDSKVAGGQQGIYQSYGKKVTISKKNYPIYSDFEWSKRGNSNNYYQQNLTAKGKYEHFNGETYYSIYNSKGNWQGYIDAKATSQEAEKLKRVQELLNRKYKLNNFGIYVLSLSDGSTASINGTKTYTAASTGKLPAMYYTQKMINEKRIDPHKKYLYTDSINNMTTYSYMRGGAGILQSKPFGTYYSLDTMLNWTAKYSDNQGANFLGYYGANKYDAEMRNEISRIIGRKWTSPFQVSAKENAFLIAEMNRQGGQVMKYMQNTIFDNQRIPKYLPVKVAHKIGDVGIYTHDVAVVYTNQPYVLSVMTEYGSYETISILSKEIYNIMK